MMRRRVCGGRRARKLRVECIRRFGIMKRLLLRRPCGRLPRWLLHCVCHTRLMNVDVLWLVAHRLRLAEQNGVYGLNNRLLALLRLLLMLLHVMMLLRLRMLLRDAAKLTMNKIFDAAKILKGCNPTNWRLAKTATT